MPGTSDNIFADRACSSINPIPVLKDNIIWIWTSGREAIVVDPALSKPVEELLIENEFQLIAILQTHHHSDHIGGTKALLKRWPEAEVIASSEDIERIPFQTISVNDEDVISLMGREVKVIGVKGHTKNHLAFFLPANESCGEPPALFCGDTLFSAGCGRIFEGSPKDMYNSLKKLASLPGETRVYCAHEYTKDNLSWAISLYPNNIELVERYKEVSKLRSNGELSLPSNISIEKRTNLFLRAQNIQELKKLREHKDKWRS